ncbi:hypothetical protein SH668x_000925 [Planctomicrobium sp. SH668]|uniref:hypothetical protein n=1 Tax=Planctomicrobium sp. SH668 TaxID=3448126 RepID=UPI003F5B2524
MFAVPLLRARQLLCLCISLALVSPALPIQAEDPPQVSIPEGVKLKTPSIPEGVVGAMREINEKLAAKGPADQNAVLWLMQIYGPNALDVPLEAATLEMLGIESISAPSPLYVSIPEFINASDEITPEQVNDANVKLEDQLILAGEALLNTQDAGLLKGYLEVNRECLKSLRKASTLPYYYAPLIDFEEPPRLMSASVVIERRLPYLMRMLAAEASIAVQEGQFDLCLENVIAIQKLARLLANGSPFELSVAKAQMMEALGYNVVRGMLQRGDLTKDQLAALLVAYNELPPYPSPAECAEIGERAIIHQEIELLQQDKNSVIGFFEEEGGGEPTEEQMKSMAEVRLKLAIERADEIQDQVAKALATRDREKQNEMFDQLDKAFEAWESTVDAKMVAISANLAKEPKIVSQWVGETMAMSLRCNYRQRRHSEDRQLIRNDLSVLGLALELYQRDNGEFPESLDALTPEILKTLPADAASGGSYIYQRISPKEAKLMSLGINQRDDAGQLYNDDFEILLK